MNKVRYRKPVRPFRTIKINPNRVNRGDTISYIYGLGRVKGGNWDRQKKPIHDHPTFKGLRERFEDGEDWVETSYVRERRQKFKHGKQVKGCTNVQDFVKKRCQYVDELYHGIAQNGYRPASEREATVGVGTSSHNLEPIVSIGRDGEILFSGSGKHRFCIAQILDMEIPVHVACRHREWQELRDDIYDNGLTEEHGEEIRNHPDLQDVI